MNFWLITVPTLYFKAEGKGLGIPNTRGEALSARLYGFHMVMTGVSSRRASCFPW